MSLLFGDIYEAIRTLRVQKGVCEKDILNFVQDKAGGCMKVANKMTEFKYPLLEVIRAIEDIQRSKGPTESEVCDFVRHYNKAFDKPSKVLKTIKTLKKLVDDGVLVKKGKRYMFASAAKCPNEEDDDDDDEEEEEDDDDDDDDDNECEPEEDECNQEEEEEDDCCDEEEEENESDKENDQCCPGADDDDDDDDDEEDDDDDDDDDENCDENEEDAKDLSNGKDGAPEADPSKNNGKDLQCVSAEKIVLSTSKGKSEENNRSEGKSRERQCLTTEGGNENNTERQTERELIATSSDGLSRGGTESIAFCVRDLLDSLYRPSSQSRCKDDENFNDVVDVLHENMDPAKNEDIGKILQDRKRKFQTKRTKATRKKYRSRSPIKKNEANAFASLKLECIKDLCCRTISSQYLHEPMDADVDIALEKDNEVEIEIESDYHNPFGVLSSTASMAVVEKKKSNSIYEEQKEKSFVQNNAQLKLTTCDNKNVKNISNPLEEEDEDDEEKEKRRRKVKRKEKYVEEEINISDDEKTSMCSICEKEKRQ